MNTVIIMAVFTIALICFSNVCCVLFAWKSGGWRGIDVRCFDFLLATLCLFGCFVLSNGSGTISVGHNGVFDFRCWIRKPEDACGEYSLANTMMSLNQILQYVERGNHMFDTSVLQPLSVRETITILAPDVRQVNET
jgi:ascorbate-specific PTS system EIIC-type component UlaA